MTLLKYYRQESARHADVDRIQGTFEMMQKMSRALFKHFHVNPIKTVLLDRKKKQFRRRRARNIHSWYDSRAKEIVYHPMDLTPLTAAHEVAHYVDDVRHQQAKVHRHRYHSVKHKSLVDQGVAVLKAHPDFQAYFLNPIKARTEAIQNVVKELVHETSAELVDNVAIGDKMVKDFFDALPERLSCARCSHVLPKRNFGVRVMKRDENGIPLKIRRQSYCSACR